MHVLFIQNNALDESQALIDLAAYLEAHGHRCSLLLDREETDLAHSTRAAQPELILIACSMLNHWWARNAAKRLQNALDVPIVMAGTGPTLYPDMLSDTRLTAIIRGEAEAPMVALVDALESGACDTDITDIPGLYQWQSNSWHGTATGVPTPMTSVPLANKDLYYNRYPFMRQFPFKRFLTSRGCHHRCTYCYISSLNQLLPDKRSRKVRRKDPLQAVEEVAREAAVGPLTHVHFSDDLFTNDPQWLEEFAPLYRERVGIPFTCNTSAELIDERVALALSEAGCHAIGFAVETANPELRLNVLRKGVRTEHMHHAAQSLRQVGIRLATFNMIALPGETPEQALETAQLNADLGTDYIRLNYAFPMPGTGMTDYAIEHGYLPQDWAERFCSPDFRYKPGPQFKTPHVQEFKNLFLLFRMASKNSVLLGVVRSLLSSPTPSFLHRILSLQGAWNEKRNFRIPVTAGLRFFAQVGRPEMRATNFPALV
jgi:radical SAM superfamily enzyme YgiQ (UPF0313 family)